MTSRELVTERPATALEVMWAAGLNDWQIQNLVWLKQDILTGKRSDVTSEHKHLMFARHLYEQGVLHD